jgi:glycosyltransferase involved in cell wall biosynthesis
MLVSVVVPAYRAQATIVRAVTSVLAQTHTDWEAVVVSDDGFDYVELLTQGGIGDLRIRGISTGHVGSGCHNARNAGLAVARGDVIAALDADDSFRPRRLEALLPVACRDGAATDNPVVIDDASGRELRHARSGSFTFVQLDVGALLALSVPLFPLVMREHAEPRLPGVELGEDFVANLRLIDRIGGLTMLGETLSEYRVVTGSLCHNDESAAGFEKSYTDLIERLSCGDRLGLSARNAIVARDGLLQKRDVNRAFAKARSQNSALDFQSFVAGGR